MDYSLLIGIHYRSKRVIENDSNPICYRQINNHLLSIHSSDFNEAEREGYELSYNREVKNNNKNRNRSTSLPIIRDKDIKENDKNEIKMKNFENFFNIGDEEGNIEISNKNMIYQINYQDLKKKKKKKMEKTVSTNSNSNNNSIDSNYTETIDPSIQTLDFYTSSCSSFKKNNHEIIESDAEDKILSDEFEDGEEDESEEEDDDSDESEEEADIDEGDSDQDETDDDDYYNSSKISIPWTNRLDLGINSRDSEGKKGDEIYFLGIIDILQLYNTGKKMETIVKVSKYLNIK